MQVEINTEEVKTVKKSVYISKSAVVPVWVTGGAICAKCGYRVDEGGLQNPETAIVAKMEDSARHLYFHHDCFLKC